MIKVLVIGNIGFKPGFECIKPHGIELTYQVRDSAWKRSKLSQKASVFNKHDVVHYFWGRINTKEILYLLLTGKKVIVNFIGTDVLLLKKKWKEVLILRLLRFFSVKCYAGSEQLVSELKQVHIQSKCLNFVNRPILDYEQSYPSTLKVICDIPEGREDFYSLDKILYCARLLPDTEFLILRNQGQFQLDNVSTILSVPWDEMVELFNNYSVYVRMTEHDSLSTSVLETLACARHVIWTQPFPHCIPAKTQDELYNILKDKDRFSQSNKTGKEYVLENFSPEAITKQYQKAWSN